MLDPQGLRQRSDMLQAIRAFFLERSYIEVDTPIRLPVLIPEAHLVPVPSDGAFLQPSPELCMKQLLARGCSRIFQICHCFRKHEQGRLHQPEFTMLEWYHKGWDYIALMEECEALLATLAEQLSSLPGLVRASQLRWQDCLVQLQPPWERLRVADAFARYAGMSAVEAICADRFDEILVTEVEPHLGRVRPTFLYDYPVELGSLARRSPENPEVSERFELYIAGIELANGFSELADPNEQRQRFVNEIEMMRSQGHPAFMPERFLASLPHMGEAAGIALGIDRLFMLFAGKHSLAESIPFLFADL
ncbi:MAG: EF-P lysine aminoacylase EpmA [Desulfobulbus sp.]|jgi:lysyl-tRNA synthetase class 2